MTGDEEGGRVRGVGGGCILYIFLPDGAMDEAQEGQEGVRPHHLRNICNPFQMIQVRKLYFKQSQNLIVLLA